MSPQSSSSWCGLYLLAAENGRQRNKEWVIRHAIFLIQLDVPHCSKILPTTAIGRPWLAWPWPNEAAWQPLPEPMPIDTFSPSFNFCQKSLIQFLKFYYRSHSVLKLDVPHCSKILPTSRHRPAFAGLGWSWLAWPWPNEAVRPYGRLAATAWANAYRYFFA